MKLDSKKKKILIITGSVLLLGGIGYLLYRRNQNKKALLEQQKLSEGVLLDGVELDEDGEIIDKVPITTVGATSVGTTSVGTLTTTPTPTAPKMTKAGYYPVSIKVERVIGNKSIQLTKDISRATRMQMMGSAKLSVTRKGQSKVERKEGVQIDKSRMGNLNRIEFRTKLSQFIQSAGNRGYDVYFNFQVFRPARPIIQLKAKSVQVLTRR